MIILTTLSARAADCYVYCENVMQCRCWHQLAKHCREDLGKKATTVSRKMCGGCSGRRAGWFGQARRNIILIIVVGEIYRVEQNAVK